MTKANSAFIKGYADSSIGQVHYRTTGEGPAVVLLHWTPLSSQMFRHLMPFIAAAGYAVYAFDLPGYGRSDPRPEQFSMNAYGKIMAEATMAIGLEEISLVLGGHNGASVAIEMALEASDRVRRLVIDGVPFLTPELRSILMGMANTPRPSFGDEHNVKTLAFDRAEAVLREYLPDFELNDETLDHVWEIMIDYLEIDFVSSGDVAGKYDPAAQLPKINQPTLILGAEKDSMAGSFATACELIPSATSHFFKGNHPLYIAGENQRYAREILSFVQT